MQCTSRPLVNERQVGPWASGAAGERASRVAGVCVGGTAGWPVPTSWPRNSTHSPAEVSKSTRTFSCPSSKARCVDATASTTASSNDAGRSVSSPASAARSLKRGEPRARKGAAPNRTGSRDCPRANAEQEKRSRLATPARATVATRRAMTSNFGKYIFVEGIDIDFILLTRVLKPASILVSQSPKEQ